MDEIAYALGPVIPENQSGLIGSLDYVIGTTDSPWEEENTQKYKKLKPRFQSPQVRGVAEFEGLDPVAQRLVVMYGQRKQVCFYITQG